MPIHFIGFVLQVVNGNRCIANCQGITKFAKFDHCPSYFVRGLHSDPYEMPHWLSQSVEAEEYGESCVMFHSINDVVQCLGKSSQIFPVNRRHKCAIELLVNLA